MLKTRSPTWIHALEKDACVAAAAGVNTDSIAAPGKIG